MCRELPYLRGRGTLIGHSRQKPLRKRVALEALLPISQPLQRGHPTFAASTLSFPLICPFLGEHLPEASSVPGTVRELAGQHWAPCAEPRT